MNVDNSFTAFFDEYPGGMIESAAAVAARLFEGLGDSLPQTALGRSPCELHWRRAVDEWQEVAFFLFCFLAAGICIPQWVLYRPTDRAA